MIKLSDSSEGGWDTVNCYVTNPLASDSDDEKRIFKAENKALKKRNDKQLKRKTPYNQLIPRNNYAAATISQPASSCSPLFDLPCTTLLLVLNNFFRATNNHTVVGLAFPVARPSLFPQTAMTGKEMN